MKKYVILFFVFLSFLSCQHDDNFSVNAKITFSFAASPITGGRMKDDITPSFVVLSIKAASGKEQNDIKLPLLAFGKSFVSDDLELQTGNYQLTQFFVLDSTNKIIYAAPLEGSDKASKVTEPLPVNFLVTNESSTVVPQVIVVLENDKPENFGYTSFGFEVVSTTATVLIKSAVVLKVGNVIYENLDAIITVKGYDFFNIEQWTKDFNFTGPSNVLEIKNGFHHYSIALVNK